MTEILLDVTTDMMEEVAGEVVSRARMKGTHITSPSHLYTLPCRLTPGGAESFIRLAWQVLILTFPFQMFLKILVIGSK